WNNRNNNREDALGITGHRVSVFTGGTSAETAGYFFQNNKEDITFDQYSGYTKIFFGHLSDGSEAEDYTAGNVIINSAAEGSNISLITNQSYNIDVEDDEQVNKILNSLAGKLIYAGYADGERNLTAQVQIAESLTGSSAILTTGDMNFYATTGQGYYGKQVHVAGIYTTDITGSAADAEFVNANVTEDFKTYNFTDSVEGEETSKVILQGIKVAGDTGNYKDEKDVTINIVADQAELNDSINVGYRGTVELKADTVTIKGVENTAIDNYGGTLTVDGDVEISDVANGIHTSSKAEVAGAEFIGTVNIKGQANITSEGTAIATEGGQVSVGAGSSITSTSGDAIVAQGQRLFSMQVGYYDKEVAGVVNVAGGTISAAKGNAINAAGGQVYVNEKGGNDTNITGNILVAKDAATVGTQTEDTPQQSIVDITLDTEKSSWNGSLSVADGQVMNLTLANGATWTDAISALDGNTITNLIGGTSSDTAGTIKRNDTRDLTITNYSGWTNIYYEHAEDDATKMIGGDTIIKTAAEGSGINMITGSYGVKTDDKEQVTAVLSALANKLFYEEAAEQKAEENGAEAVMFAAANDEDSTANTFKLQAKALISEGLTTSAKVASGTVKFKTDKDGQGFVTLDDVVIGGGDPVVPPVDDEHDSLDDVVIVTGGEPVTMRAIKSSMAAATMMWRSENNDLMKRMGDLRVLEGERGMWAKYYTGKQEMDAQDANFSEKYKAYQIGYDTKVNENWTVGAALSYNDGTSSTSNVANGATGAWANGHGEQKNISLGVYGSWKAKDGQYADIIVKASRLDNDYKLKFNNGIGTYNIEGDYKTWGTSISAEYGKRFEGDKGTYFEPSAELTYGHMAGKSYSAGTNYYGSTMYMDQDSFDTLVGRIGLRVGQKLEKGSYFAKLALAHEFCGDFDTRYNVDGTDHNKTHLDFGDTWYELQIGGTAKLSANSMLYADFQRSFGGDVTEKWRVDAG
ncbi:MAG: autotransporter outer membrane beta-barrel domain-containing protein, partial [Phascolarctobacterium sp.]